MKRINGMAGDTIYLTITKLVTTLAGIITTKILSVNLSLSEYGTYSQALVIISVVSSLIFCGLGDAINFYYNGSFKNDEEKKRKVVNTIFAIEMVLWIISFLTIVLGHNLIVYFFSNPALAPLLVLVGIKPALDNYLYFYQILFVSIGKARMIATRNLIVSIGRIIAMFVVVKFFHDLWFILFALIAIDLLQLLIFKVILSHHSITINPFKSSAKMVPLILSYGLPMALYSITNMFSRDIDKLVIGAMADEEVLAVYSNCARILPFDIFTVSLATILMPVIITLVSTKMLDKAVGLFRTYLQAGYYSVWIFAGAVLLVTQEIIPFLYSDQYSSGAGVFVIYILDSMLRFASMHLILTATGKTKLLMTYSLVSLGMNFVLNILLYRLIGMLGPAIATLVSTFVYTLLVLHSSAKELNIGVSKLFVIKDIVSFVIKLFVTGIPLYFAKNILLGFGVNKYVLMIVIAGMFVLINFVLNLKKIKNILKQINSIKQNKET